MAIKRKKISVIGGGFTGATTALMLAQKELGDVVLVDIPQMEDPTKGKALDMVEASPVQGFDANITGTSNYEDTKDSDIVVITAGIARKPGMSRDDLVQTNQKIMKSVTQEIVKYSPECIIIVLTNPVDAMTYTVFKESGFPKNRVIGQSGVLDTARFRTFVAQELNLSVKDITGFVLGGHGDDMVPLVRYSYAGGIPLETLIPQDRLDAIVERTRKGGGEIVGLWEMGVLIMHQLLRLFKWLKPFSKINGESSQPSLTLKVSMVLKGFTLAYRQFLVEMVLNKSLNLIWKMKNKRHLPSQQILLEM